MTDRATSDPTIAPTAPSPHRQRAIAAMVLIVVGSLLAPVAVVGWFVRNQILDTDQFVATVAPLVEDTAIQVALVERVATEVVRLADNVRPGLVTHEQVVDAAQGFVATPEFAQVWRTIMREAHPQLEQVLLGRDTELLRTADGEVQVDLVGVAREVQTRLIAAGVTQAADLQIEGEVLLPLFESHELARLQRANDLIERLVPWLVAAALIAFVVAIAVAPRRAVALRWIGIGLLIGAFVLGAGLLIARLQYIAALEAIIPEDAAAAAYTILLDPLIGWIRIWIGVALVLIVVGLLLAPWRRGPAARPERVSPAQWFAGHKASVVAVAIALGFGVILMWHRPTLVVLLVTAGAVAALIVAALLFGGRASEEMGA